MRMKRWKRFPSLSSSVSMCCRRNDEAGAKLLISYSGRTRPKSGIYVCASRLDFSRRNFCVQSSGKEEGGQLLPIPNEIGNERSFFYLERESVFSSSPSPCLGERRLADLFKSVCLVCIQSNAVMSRSFSLYPEWIMRCPLLDLPDGGSCGRPLGHKKAFNTRVCSTNSYIRKIKKFTKLNS